MHLMCADTIVVVVAPLTPTSELSHMAAGTAPANEDDDDDDVERFRWVSSHQRVVVAFVSPSCHLVTRPTPRPSPISAYMLR